MIQPSSQKVVNIRKKNGSEKVLGNMKIGPGEVKKLLQGDEKVA